MARIRIVDEWLRSPVSIPARHRLIMVVAETWAEQKVLMRAYATCLDQTQPTIGLQGRELPIGPAGTDPHGPWAIHVMPPADGWAQELRGLLEMAAKHVAGSKGNPPRLADEVPLEERKPTSPWVGRRGQPDAGAPLAAPGPSGVQSFPVQSSGPGARTVMASQPSGAIGGPPTAVPQGSAMEPAASSYPTDVTPAPFPGHPSFAQSVPVAHRPAAPTPVPFHRPAGFGMSTAPQGSGGGASGGPRAAAPAPGFSGRRTPFPGARPGPQAARARRAKRQTQTPPLVGGRTSFGHTGADTPVNERRSYHTGAEQVSLATVVGKTMPIGFRISEAERAVLDALSRGEILDDGRVSSLANVGDARDFMGRLADKLAGHGLDLIEPTAAGYRLRRG